MRVCSVFSNPLCIGWLMLASVSLHRKHLPAFSASLCRYVALRARSRSQTRHLQSIKKLRKLPSFSHGVLLSFSISLCLFFILFYLWTLSVWSCHFVYWVCVQFMTLTLTVKLFSSGCKEQKSMHFSNLQLSPSALRCDHQDWWGWILSLDSSLNQNVRGSISGPAVTFLEETHHSKLPQCSVIRVWVDTLIHMSSPHSCLHQCINVVLTATFLAI